MLSRTKRYSLLVLLALGLIIHGCGTEEQESSALPGDTTTAANTEESKGRDSVSVTLVGQDSVTVLELLQMSHYVESRSTAMGSFVTGIDSIRGGTSGYWVYTINDTVPKTAADKMFTRSGDKSV